MESLYKENFYKAVCAWNKKKSFKTFFAMYKHGFEYPTIKDLFGWRIYRIIRNTLNGKYEWCEAELEKQRKDRADLHSRVENSVDSDPSKNLENKILNAEQRTDTVQKKTPIKENER